MTIRDNLIAVGALAALTLAGPAFAEDTIKIGASVGMTGYAAAIDRAWKDGAEVAVEFLNSKGGVLGKKLELIAEDNKSEPQEAVTVYRKMISSDKVNVFVSGCVSAGNFAAAQHVVRAEIPMVLCSILPKKPEEIKWAVSLLPPPKFETEKRYEYLQKSTKIRKVGILHDPTPYANLQKTIAESVAKNFDIELVGVEQYKQDDADLSPQISKLAAAGAGAILKIGIGGSTVTAAKNVKQLGLDVILMGGGDDLAVTVPAGEALGDKFIFAAAPAQVFDELPDSPIKKQIADFLPLWQAKHGKRDPYWGGKGWDGVMLAVSAIKTANGVDGEKVRAALENTASFNGTGAVYSFSPEGHIGVKENPFFIATIVGGKVKIK